MKTIKSSPILSSIAKNGERKYWQGHIVQEGEDYFLQSTSWHDLVDGGVSKKNVSTPYPVSIKNVGKANETAPLEQAESEFESMVKAQTDKKNYLPVGTKAIKGKLPLPMLAEKWKDQSKKIVYPCFVQRKFDGNRMIFEGTRGQTRGGQPFIPEVIQHFTFDTQGYLLDGEVMLPGAKLQTSMTAIRKFRPELSPSLEYFVYDIVYENLMFFERLAILKKLSKEFPANVKLVETSLVKNETEIQKWHEQFVLEGYEGTIVRNYEGMYNVGHRSCDLQKKKDFQEQEYQVIGFKEGAGLYKGCAIFRCVTKDGEEFDSNPEGTLEHKRELFKNGKSYIGKWLTVRYFDTSISGKPGFNVGVDFRDEGEF